MEIEPNIINELTDYQSWAKGIQSPRPFSLFDYVSCVGNADSFFGFAELFYPTLIDHNGHQFLASKFSREAYDLWVAQNTSPIEIQRVMNHVHVHTIMQQQDASDELADEVARVLAKIWSRTLREYNLTV